MKGRNATQQLLSCLWMVLLENRTVGNGSGCAGGSSSSQTQALVPRHQCPGRAEARVTAGAS